MLEKNNMKISIITGCFNSEKHIASAIESVTSQSYKNIEYIIIDGGSTDKTNNIISSYSNKISKHISEPDDGIYDAMNKGIKLATGDLIGILNSDDYYKDNHVIEKIAQVYKQYNTDCIYSNIDYVNHTRDDMIIRKWVSGPYKPNSFKKGWHPAHPGFFVKNEIFDKFGNYDITYEVAADFELMLRFLEKNRISSYYFPESIINMRLGGTSNKSLRNIINGNRECLRAFKKNDLEVSILYPFLRLLPKINQFLN